MHFPISFLPTNPARVLMHQGLRDPVPPSCWGCCAPCAMSAWHGQGPIQRCFRHTEGPGSICGASSLLNACEHRADSTAAEALFLLPAPSCTPKTHQNTPPPPLPELPKSNWGPLSLWGHHLQPFHSASISHQGWNPRSSSCKATMAPGHPSHW